MKKYLIICAIILLVSSCVERHHLHLKNKDNQDVTLFENDSVSLHIKGGYPSVDTFLGAKNIGYTPNYNSESVYFTLETKYIESLDSLYIRINKMSLNIWTIKKDTVLLNKGQIKLWIPQKPKGYDLILNITDTIKIIQKLLNI